MSARLLRVAGRRAGAGFWVHAAGHAVTDGAPDRRVHEDRGRRDDGRHRDDRAGGLRRGAARPADAARRPAQRRARRRPARRAVRSGRRRGGRGGYGRRRRRIARVRVHLARPATPVGPQPANAVIVEFGGAAAAGRRQAAACRRRRAVRRRREARRRDGAVRHRPARLTKVETTTGARRDPHRLQRHRQPGGPAPIEPARDMPPRLVVDFPEVRSTLPAVTTVGKGPVDRIRVAVNRVNPLVTRAVIDLKYPAAAPRRDGRRAASSSCSTEPEPPAAPTAPRSCGPTRRPAPPPRRPRTEARAAAPGEAAPAPEPKREAEGPAAAVPRGHPA